MKKYLLSLLFMFSVFGGAFAQLQVTGGFTAEQLANYFTGPSITPFNCSIEGEDGQIGKFTFGGNELGVSSGVIMSTGDIFDAVGPNSSANISYEWGGYGDDFLSDEYGLDTYDAIVLEFDFTVQTDKIDFNYVFLSDEYLENVNSGYNDLFAFVISGPGIVGEKNIAVVPGSTTPVTINTINDQSYWQFYHDNADGNTNIEFDGFTTLMTATAEGLTACETYHLKLVIADGDDESFDSGVLLQESSLSQSILNVSTNTFSGNDIAIESCVNASFTFQLDQPQPKDLQIDLEIAGTAVNGVDYQYIDPQVIIPAGQTSATLVVKAINDGLVEGQESIYLIYSPAACQVADTSKLFIQDFDQIIYSASPTDISCNGYEDGIADFNLEGGFAPYTFNVTDTLTHELNTYTSLPITGLDSGTYQVQIIDSYGCTAKDIVFAGEFNAGQTFLPDGNGVAYESVIQISGFNDGQVLETADQILGITAILEHSYANDLTIAVQAPNGSQVILKSFDPSGGGTCDLGEPVASGPVDNWNGSNVTPGLGYEYTWNANPVYGTMNSELQLSLLEHTYVSTFGNTLTDNYLPAGSYATENSFATFIGTELNGDWKILVTDNMGQDNGYIFSWNIGLKADKPDSIFNINEPAKPIVTGNVTNSTCGASDANINITVTGDNSPFTYEWSTGVTTEDISDLSSGPYTVEITNSNLCVSSEQFNVSDNGGSLVIEGEMTDETCFETSNGIIDLTVSGTAPISFSWASGETTEDINNLANGDYTVTVSDGSNCNVIETFSILEATDIIISGNVTNEQCGDAEGLIDLTVNGGTFPYTFLWSNGETTQSLDELSLGDYSVTVTDSKNCTKEISFTITNLIGNCVPDCDIEITNAEITNEICGNINGEINLTVFTSYSPYNISWSNDATDSNISSLTGGAYTVLVTDAEGCNLTQTFTVENETGDLAVINSVKTDENCGNGNGTIEVSVSGGALPYSFSWTNAGTTQNLTNLSEGDYTITVSDANNCSVSHTETVENIAGSLVQTWGNASNETCSNSSGSIDIQITGGNLPYAYLWSNGAVSQDLIGISAGTYSCTITDDTGCIISTPEYNVLNEAGTLSLDNIDVDNEICGNGLGEIETIISGGTEPYTFVWTTGQTSQDVFNLTAGIYNLTVSDDNGCSVSTGNINLINSAGTLQLQSVDVTHETCGNGEGAINVSVINGTAPYSYSWANGNTAEDLVGLSEGNFSCIITDNNGCEVSFNTSINNEQGNLTVDNVDVTNEVCGNGTGTLNVTTSGGNFPLTFLWSNSETSLNLTDLSEGEYSVTITDDNGCQALASADIINDAGTLNLDNYAVTNELCGDAQGNIQLTVSGDEAPILYAWSNGGTTEDIGSLATGVYTCIITDNIGCQITAGPYNVNDFSQSLVIDDVIITNEICNNAQGSIELLASGGTGLLSYSWNVLGNSNLLIGIPSDTYTYTVTDETGCSISGNADITNSSGTLDIASFSPQNEYCGNNDGKIDITVTGGSQPYYYTWNTGATSQDLLSLPAGSYSVIVRDLNGCEVQSPNITLIDDNGDIEISEFLITDETCSSTNGEIDITVTGGSFPIFYNWGSGSTTQDINNLQAGNFSVEVRDGQGCIISEVYTVENIVDDFNADATIVTDENCGLDDGTIQIDVSPAGSYTYNWDNGETNSVLINLSADSYSCIITNDLGCALNVSFDVDNITNGLSVSRVNFANDYCNAASGNIEVAVTGGVEPYLFAWSNGETTQNIIALAAGTYTLEVTDDTGCKTVFSQQIFNNVNEDLGIVDVNFINDECGQGIATISYSAAVAGSYIYKLDGVQNIDNTPSFENLIEGDYVISIHDGGCVVHETVTIDNNANFGVFLQDVQPSFCGDPNGSINIQIGPPNNTYEYDWSNGATTQDIQDLEAGDYDCTVTNMTTGCVNTVSVTVPAEGWFTATAEITNEMCGNGNGSVTINIVDQFNEPKTILWNTGETVETISNLSQGTYICTISAINFACEVEVVAEVINNTGTLQVSEFVNNDDCNNANGNINLAITGAPQGYSVLWNTGATTESISNLVAGDYSVTVTDNETSCEFNSDYTVDALGSFTFTESVIRSSCTSCADGEIDITMTPADSYTFVWSNTESTEDITDLLPNIYTVLITNDLGCESTRAITVDECDLDITSNTVTNEECQNGLGSIDLTTGGGVAPIEYVWNNTGTTSLIENLSAGSYTVQVTDNAGCLATGTYEVANIVNFPTVSVNVVNETCGAGNGSAEVQSISPGSYFYSWSNGATEREILNVAAGLYQVTITDALGCELIENLEILNETNGLEVTLNSETEDYCNNGDGEIDIDVNNGNLPYSFLWTNGETTEDITAITGGIYSVEVTDDSGCKFTFEHELTNAVNETLAIININVVNDQCGQSNGSVTFNANESGSFVYKLDDVPNFDNTSSFDNLAAGEYVISVHQGNCLAYETIVIENEAEFNTQIVSVDEEFCGNSDGGIVVQVFPPFGNYSYEWSNGTTNQELTNVPAGVYNCIITNLTSGCQATITQEVSANGWFTASGTAIDETCGQGNGSIDIVVVDFAGDPNYFIWDTGETTEDLDNLSAGDYSVTVTDDFGCTAIVDVEVVNNTGSLALTDYVFANNCNNSQGAIDLNVTGATNGYSVLWSNGEITTDIINLDAGDYSVTITDDINGCTLTADYTIETVGVFTVLENLIGSSCAECNDGSINLTIIPGGVYEYSWSNGADTEDVTALLPGDYSVDINNAFGCLFSETYTVNFNIGIDQISAEAFVRVYPNPAKDIIHFECDFSNKQTELVIYDIVGQKVVQQDFELGSSILKVNTHNFRAGIYLAKITSGGKTNLVKFMIEE